MMRAKKHLGQHFLSDQNILGKIAEAAHLTKKDCVIEIGPGRGALTEFLVEQAGEVIAVEKDHSLQTLLEEKFKNQSHLKIIFGDFLDFDWNEIDSRSFDRPLRGKLRTNGLDPRNDKVKVVGNIPYNISHPILFRILEAREKMTTAVLTVQKEVALRWAALPGGREYGIPTVLLQAYGSVERLFDIQPGSFQPPPKVMSSVLRIQFGAPLYDIKEPQALTRLVRRAFGMRRKTLENNLKEFYPTEILKKALQRVQMDPKIRAEKISVREYVTLANTLAELL